MEIKDEKDNVNGIDIIGNYSKSKYQAKVIVNKNGIVPTIRENHGQVTGIVVKENNIGLFDFDSSENFCKGKRDKGISDIFPTIRTKPRMGIYLVKKEGNMLKGGKQLNETIEKNIDMFKKGKVLDMDLYNRTVKENISQTITDDKHSKQRLFDGLRIRKLTPKECWRLMGFDDEDYEKAAKVNSNSQLYKQAGNSIVVNVLEAILTNLLLEQKVKGTKVQTTIYDFMG